VAVGSTTASAILCTSVLCLFWVEIILDGHTSWQAYF
jgi:hypothetical protein